MKIQLNSYPINSLALDIATFLSLSPGAVLVSPLGSIFIYLSTVDEYVPSGLPNDPIENLREFHILDMGDTRRRVVFNDDGMSEYGYLLSLHGLVSDTTGIEKTSGKDHDEDYNQHYDVETGWVD
jgi:hypothetical protein